MEVDMEWVLGEKEGMMYFSERLWRITTIIKWIVGIILLAFIVLFRTKTFTDYIIFIIAFGFVIFFVWLIGKRCPYCWFINLRGSATCIWCKSSLEEESKEPLLKKDKILMRAAYSILVGLTIIIIFIYSSSNISNINRVVVFTMWVILFTASLIALKVVEKKIK